MAHGSLYQFNVIGLALCGMHIRWKRRRHYFCSQFVSEVLEKSGAMELPKHSTLMHPKTTPGWKSCGAYTRVHWPACRSASRWNLTRTIR